MEIVCGDDGKCQLILEEYIKKTQKVSKVKDIERSIIKKFRKSIWVPFIKAIKEYELINDGDKIAVCISGGKDSMLLAKLFQELHRHGKKNFDVVFLNMNPGYNDFNSKMVETNARILGIPMETFHTKIFDTVVGLDGSPCYICARMRRGNLYKEAQARGCNKIALGHHFDDVIETILMSMLYSGQTRNMPPKLKATNFLGMELIRPLYLVREPDIISWRDYNELEFIRCACRFTEMTETGQGKTSKRAETKKIIAKLKEENPYVESNIFKSMENVSLDTVIKYKKNGIEHSFLEDY